MTRRENVLLVVLSNLVLEAKALCQNTSVIRCTVYATFYRKIIFFLHQTNCFEFMGL